MSLENLPRGTETLSRQNMLLAMSFTFNMRLVHKRGKHEDVALGWQ